MGKKEVSNEEYVKALADTNNVRIMKSVTTRFQRILDEDTLYNCELHGLLRSLQYHNTDKGQKFTSFLYNATLWECIREYNKLKKYRNRNVSINDTNLDVAHSPSEEIKWLRECIETLPLHHQKIIKEYYLEGRTMQEIGDINGYSKETARNKINKAEAALRKRFAG